jgi:hypothetical protein
MVKKKIIANPPDIFLTHYVMLCNAFSTFTNGREAQIN